MNSLLYHKGIELPVKGKKLLALINQEHCTFGVAIPFTKPFTKPQCRIKKFVLREIISTLWLSPLCQFAGLVETAILISCERASNTFGYCNVW